MKRFWVGIAVLAALLGVSLWAGGQMAQVHSPVSRRLAEAADAALAGDWETAESLATDARTAWERNWHFTAAVADHAPMDEVDGLFAQIGVFAGEREAVHFAATCAQLSRLTTAIEEAHGLNWWNLL